MYACSPYKEESGSSSKIFLSKYICQAPSTHCAILTNVSVRSGSCHGRLM
jgi:hypothetical protein